MAYNATKSISYQNGEVLGYNIDTKGSELGQMQIGGDINEHIQDSETTNS